MKSKILKIQIVQLVFILILFMISIMQKNGIINVDKSLMALYIISILLYWLVLIIIIITLMHKNKKDEKKLFLNLVLITIELILLGIFCGLIDSREFIKHCAETTATVYDIKENEERKAVYIGDPKKRK